MRFKDNAREIIIKGANEEHVQEAYRACQSAISPKNNFQFAVGLQTLIFKVGKLVARASLQFVPDFSNCIDAISFICNQVTYNHIFYEQFAREGLNLRANITKHAMMNVRINYPAAIALYNNMLTDIERKINQGRCFDSVRINMQHSNSRNRQKEIKSAKFGVPDCGGLFSAEIIDFKGRLRDGKKEKVVFTFAVIIERGEMLSPRLIKATFIDKDDNLRNLKERRDGMYECAIPTEVLSGNQIEIKLFFCYDYRMKISGHLLPRKMRKDITLVLRKNF